MKSFLFVFAFLFAFSFNAQTTLSGKVIDAKGEPIEGANVYLEGTYDGTSSLIDGTFRFATNESGTKTLVVSFISYETYYKTATVTSLNNLIIKLREDVNSLDAVEINAGSFEAGDNAKKVAALNPIDIATTASALGDVYGAFQTLPGTSANAEDGRLFVRGGDADETQIFIDGIHVANPFLATGANVPTRGRFSPFLFKGTTFSTGGYSAEFGQALSSVLSMNTIDRPTQEQTDLGIMTVGVLAGNTQIWNKNSFSINTSYINLAPYQSIFPDNNTWNKPYESLSGEMVFRYKPNEDGLLKLYSSFSFSEMDLIQDDINYKNGFNFGIKNRNLYFNGSYRQALKNNWTVFSGLSFTNDNSKIKLQSDKVVDELNGMHAKVKLRKRFSNRFKLNFGAEYYLNNFNEDFIAHTKEKFNLKFNNHLVGSFAEADVFFNKNIALKFGVRAEKSSYINKFTVSPRVSLAYKTGKNSQVSLAYGQFHQNPKNKFLKFTNALTTEKASHFIANYQYTKGKQIFRIEGYYKNYDDLVKYNGNFVNFDTNITNDGNGFAKGIDVFWRDGANIKNLEYWMSYSYLDTERNYRNYPIKARPNFASKHNASIVGKYWIKDWNSQLGFDYNFASGRTYTNPNKGGFLNQETQNYNSASVSWLYLITQQKIVYFSVNNVFGEQNVFGYRYKNEPSANGVFERQALTPNTDRFFVIGFFWTISDDKKVNQMDNF